VVVAPPPIPLLTLLLLCVPYRARAIAAHRRGGGVLQAREGLHQAERMPDRADRAGDPAVQGGCCPFAARTNLGSMRQRLCCLPACLLASVGGQMQRFVGGWDVGERAGPTPDGDTPREEGQHPAHFVPTALSAVLIPAALLRAALRAAATAVGVCAVELKLLLVAVRTCAQVFEPILVLGKERFEDVDMKIRCKGASRRRPTRVAAAAAAARPRCGVAPGC
jgi:hypothetical protein